MVNLETPQKTYSTLSHLQAVQVLKGALTLDRVFPTLLSEVQEILADNDLLVSLFAARVLNGLETMDTVPEMIRGDVDAFLGQESTSILLLVADVIDGTKQLIDINENIRELVRSEVERYLGKKLD